MINKLNFNPFSDSDLPVIRQSTISECGLACLAMIASYYGFETNMQSLRARYTVSSEGMNLRQVINISDHMGFTSRALKLEMNELDKLITPCILHWDMNHFVVLKSYDHKKIVVHDPALGEKKYSLSQASKHFTGVALELTPSIRFIKKDEKEELTLFELLSTTRGIIKTLLIVFAAGAIIQVLALAAPYYMQIVVDDVLVSFDESLLLILALGFGLAAIFKFLISAFRSYVILYFTSQINLQLSINTFSHLVKLPLEYFNRRDIGDVASRFDSIKAIVHTIANDTVTSIIDGIMAIILLCVLFYYSADLTIVILIAIVLFTLVRIVTYPAFKEKNQQLLLNQAKEHTYFLESLRGIQTIKLFGAEPNRSSVYSSKYVSSLNSGVKIGYFNIFYGSLNQLIFAVEQVIIIYLGAKLVIEGGFSAGMLIAFIAFRAQFVERVSCFIAQIFNLTLIRVHLDRLADIYFEDAEKRGDMFKSDVGTVDITLNNLSYKYGVESKSIIEDLSMTIPAGKITTIIAPSGFGKSTLLKLISGLLTPSSGSIHYGDITLSETTKHAIRENVATVMQDDTLFAGSIIDNITFGSAEPDIYKVETFAKIAQIHEEIMKMPMRYETLVGDMGSSLSGGQVQRILIARALYKEPKILLLDEATSHLDTATEGKVSDAIKSLNITRIAVAHREETVKNSDYIYDLQSRIWIDVKQYFINKGSKK